MNLDHEIEKLNDAQKEAVCYLGSPLLILAGPGSGKTRVITLKIAWLIRELQERPNSILAMTFTNKAAREMQERIQGFMNAVPEAQPEVRSSGQIEPSEEAGHVGQHTRAYVQKPFVSTFHSCGAYLLRRYHDRVGMERNFQIYDASDQLALLKEASPKLPARMLRGILSGISRAKDYGLLPDSSEELLAEFMDDPSFYQDYEALKKTTGNVDFGDLLIKPYEMMRDIEEVSTDIRRMWKWFFVDEYQDTNTIQSKWLYELCKDTANLTVVGDDDQSIYKFRGAIIENILHFEQVFDNTKVVFLGQNYRSTSEIVSFANDVIQRNSGRYNKKVFSEQSGGARPNVVYFSADNYEEDYVVEKAEEVRNTGESLAIFYRVNSQSRAYEMALRKKGFAYEVVGALEFFERLEVKDALALLRIYKNPKDIVSFMRIVNKPTRGVGKKSLRMVLDAMQQTPSWQDAWHSVQSQLTSNAVSGLIFLEQALIDEKVARKNEGGLALEHSSENKETKKFENIGEVLRRLLRESNLEDHYRMEDKSEETERMANLEELVSYVSGFANDEEGWTQFFEQVSLNEGRDAKADANGQRADVGTQSGEYSEEQIDGQPIQKSIQKPVQLITLHRSKGLEFDRVIICGLEQGLIPMVFDGSPYVEDVEEERRLFYVGITRAKTCLDITCCQKRKKYGFYENAQPSLFLREFDRELVNWVRYGITGAASGERGDAAEIWNVGDRVRHTKYGGGFVQAVAEQGKQCVIHVEFDNDYEASFIPKFTAELSRE